MENTEFIQLYNEFKEELNNDFHFQLLSETINFKEIKGNQITLKAQNDFSLDNFRARYLSSLQEKIVKKTQNKLLEIILEQQNDREKRAIPKNSVKNKNYAPEFKFGTTSRSVDYLDEGLTFKNYVEGEHNRLALAIGKAISINPKSDYNPFFIWGNVGLGKTHLLHAIGNSCKERNQKVLYTRTEDFFNNFFQSISKNKQETFRNKYRNVDVLLFDDIHDLKKKKGCQDELFHIFEYFRNEGKKLVFTCDRPPQELTDFSERLHSRLKSSGTNASISNPSYEVRLAILANRAASLNLNLTSDIMEFLAENISDSIRDLCGALTKIHSLTKLLGQEINIKIVSQELQEYFSIKQKPLLVRNIQTHVANFYNLELNDIKGKSRMANISLARQIAMYLSRELTSLSTSELGREFQRTAAAISSGVKKIKKMQQEDQKFTGELDKLKQELQQTTC